MVFRLIFLPRASPLKVSKSVGKSCRSDHHDVSLQRSAASSLPGLTAFPCGSLLSSDPVTPLRLPRRRSSPIKPARQLHPSDFHFQKPWGHSAAEPGAERFSPGVGTQHRAVCAAELQPPELQQPRLSADCLPGLRVPQVRRQCDTGTVHTER